MQIMSPFKGEVQIKGLYRDRKQINVCMGSVWGPKEVTANAYGVPFWGDQIDLELDNGDGYTTF